MAHHDREQTIQPLQLVGELSGPRSREVALSICPLQAEYNFKAVLPRLEQDLEVSILLRMDAVELVHADEAADPLGLDALKLAMVNPGELLVIICSERATSGSLTRSHLDRLGDVEYMQHGIPETRGVNRRVM